MRGAYEFKFGPSTVTLKQKLEKISGEPIAFHLYKRRDLEQKIDKLAVEQLRMAKLIYSVTQQARKDRRGYLKIQEIRHREKIQAELDAKEAREAS